jgi:hypothetical protein
LPQPPEPRPLPQLRLALQPVPPRVLPPEQQVLVQLRARVPVAQQAHRVLQARAHQVHQALQATPLLQNKKVAAKSRASMSLTTNMKSIESRGATALPSGETRSTQCSIKFRLR